MTASPSLDALADSASFFEFELVDTAAESRYALRRGDETAFEGTSSECAAFLAGWRSDRVLMIRDLVADLVVGSPEHKLSRDLRQRTIAVWARMAFGEAEATGIPQRGLRLLEEAIEAFQACGGDEAMAHKLVSFVFARPSGTVGQELGGVAVTVLALAAAAGLSAEEEECREVSRVLGKPVREFTDRNASKNAAGFKIERRGEADE